VKSVEQPPLATDKTQVVPAGALSEITILSEASPRRSATRQAVVAPGEEVEVPTSGD
jgi:hypothetical protein